MPIYEYKCEKCHKTFELVYSKDKNMDRDSIMCACGAKANRIVSACTHKIEGYCFKNEYPKEDKPNE